MKRIIIILLLTTQSTALFSQSTKKVVDKKENSVYYVLEKDPNKRHGLYTLKNKDNTVILEGRYENGVKDSVWTGYSNGKKISQYDFRTAQYNFVRAGKKKQVPIFIPDSISAPGADLSVPLYLPGMDNLRYHIVKTFFTYWPPQETPNIAVTGKIKVDEFGKAHYSINGIYPYGINEALLRTLSTLPDLWIPARKDGKWISSEMTFPLNIYNR